MECSTVLEQIVIPASAQEADAQTLYEVLRQVTDRRKPRGKRYEILKCPVYGLFHYGHAQINSNQAIQEALQKVLNNL